MDAEDDKIRRFVVQHFRYDHERHERRHVVVAAFDDEGEFEACLKSVQDDIERRRTAGEPVDRNEHASGTVRDPGHHRRAANGRLLERSLRHGVVPGAWVEGLELPRNIAVFRVDDRVGFARRLVRRLRRLLPPWLGRAGR